MPTSRRRTAILALLLVLATGARPAAAWSTKEHILLTRLAAIRLLRDPNTPPEMKAWLAAAMPGLGPDIASQRDYLLHARVGPFPRGVDGIAFWAVVPDVQALIDSGAPDRARKVEPFGVPERLLHFVDLELFMPDESQRRYRPDLSSKPKLSDLPRDHTDPRYARAGMLPFRVEQCQRELARAIREDRLNDKPAQFPRDDHAARWAGFLAHYVQDNTQPHHATEDYRSASYFGANPRGAPNVHADMEYRLIDDEFEDYPALRAELWDLLIEQLEAFEDPVQVTDPFVGTIEVALHSYDALPLIGQAAVAAYGGTPDRPGKFDPEAFYHFKGKVGDSEFTILDLKARQLAWAVRRTERAWLGAWEMAKKPLE